jgi:hypothetical protein
LLPKNKEDKLAEYQDKIIQVNGNETHYLRLSKENDVINPTLATTLRFQQCEMNFTKEKRLNIN